LRRWMVMVMAVVNWKDNRKIRWMAEREGWGDAKQMVHRLDFRRKNGHTTCQW
jgi:hypothetical protein